MATCFDLKIVSMGPFRVSGMYTAGQAAAGSTHMLVELRGVEPQGAVEGGALVVVQVPACTHGPRRSGPAFGKTTHFA
jgi:hypothetical protein